MWHTSGDLEHCVYVSFHAQQHNEAYANCRDSLLHSVQSKVPFGNDGDRLMQHSWLADLRQCNLLQ